MSEAIDVVEVAEQYYDSSDADNFYLHVWGGEDIHIGLYEPERQDVKAASRATVERIADCLKDMSSDAKVLDIGAGYGGRGVTWPNALAATRRVSTSVRRRTRATAS